MQKRITTQSESHHSYGRSYPKSQPAQFSSALVQCVFDNISYVSFDCKKQSVFLSYKYELISYFSPVRF